MLGIGRLKALARKSLLGKYCLVIGAQLLAYIIPGILLTLALSSLGMAFYAGNISGRLQVADDVLVIAGSVLFAALIILAFVTFVFMKYGVTRLYINICRDERPSLSNIFYPFTGRAHPWRVVGVEILKFVFPIVPAALFIISAFLYREVSVRGLSGSSLGIGLIAAMVITALWYLYVVSAVYLSDIVAIDDPTHGIMGSLSRANSLMKGHRIKGLWFIFISFIFWKMLMAACSLAALWVVPYMACTRIFFYLAADGGTGGTGDRVIEGSFEEAKTDEETVSDEADKVQEEPTVTEEIIKAQTQYSVLEENAVGNGESPAASVALTEETPVKADEGDELPDGDIPETIEEQPEEGTPEAAGETSVVNTPETVKETKEEAEAAPGVAEPVESGEAVPEETAGAVAVPEVPVTAAEGQEAEASPASEEEKEEKAECAAADGEPGDVL